MTPQQNHIIIIIIAHVALGPINIILNIIIMAIHF